MTMTNSKRVWNLCNFSVSANKFVSVKKADVKNAIYEYFNLIGTEHREYAILNANNRTVLIEARSGFLAPSDNAVELNGNITYMIDNMTYETIPDIISEILK